MPSDTAGFHPVVFLNRVALSGVTFRNEGSNEPVLADGASSRSAYRSQLSWSPKASLLVEAGVLMERDRDDSTFTRFLETPAITEQARQTERVVGSAWTTAGDARMTWTGRGTQALDAGVLITHSGLTGQTKAAPWIIGALPIGSRLTRGAAGLRQQRPDLAQVIGSFGRPDATMERATVVDGGFGTPARGCVSRWWRTAGRNTTSCGSKTTRHGW
jgi:hypothetical protein